MTRGRDGTPRALRRSRPKLPCILVVCGGVRTESEYVDALRRRHQDRITVLVRPKGVDPAGCVRYAVAQSREAGTAYNEVWCVVDVDQFDVDAAIRQATAADVELAVSNPCFEVWLLLHHTDVARRFTDAKDVLRELRRPSGMWRLVARIVGGRE